MGKGQSDLILLPSEKYDTFLLKEKMSENYFFFETFSNLFSKSCLSLK